LPPLLRNPEGESGNLLQKVFNVSSESFGRRSGTMIEAIQYIVFKTLEILKDNSGWMGWNLFLAFVPLGLSVVLFRSSTAEPSANSLQRSRSLLWWVGVLVFIAFLPNAPYVLTDVIHLIEAIRIYDSIWMITLVVIPMYLVFFFAGFEAYVLSLINLGYFLRRCGLGRFVLVTELVLHELSAFGIYLGRFLRFNSWDIVTQLDALTTSIVDDVARKGPLLIITLTFVLIAGLYWLMKRVTLAVLHDLGNAKIHPLKMEAKM
jgi:uncharacterized membrane protein